MSDILPFQLTTLQQEKLLALHALWEEGEEEERLARIQQREEDVESLHRFADHLRETGLESGAILTDVETLSLLSLARSLASNPNLDARLLQQPGEPAAFSDDLRDLLFGEAALPVRLSRFLQRRRTGGQTALQILCAAFPQQWPLVTGTGLRLLELNSEQQRAARQEARTRFALTKAMFQTEETPQRTSGMTTGHLLRTLEQTLSGVVVYEAIRELLHTDDYPELHRLLTSSLSRKGNGRSVRGDYALPSASIVREAEASGYRVDRTTREASSEPQERLTTLTLDLEGASQAKILTEIEQEIAVQGYEYPPLLIRSLYISLQTRPFALLSGLPGSGKSSLTRLIASALTGEIEGPASQYRLLPVRPDWSNSAPLLGMAYPFDKDRGGETPFLEIVRRASRPESAHRAYFIGFDEANLARFEHYGAELLSAMETPGRELSLPDGRVLRLPVNLFLLGTLNNDFTSHLLPRRVLDRANCLWIDDTLMKSAGPEAEKSQADKLNVGRERVTRQTVFLLRKVTTRAAVRKRLQQAGEGKLDLLSAVTETLGNVNSLLEPHGLAFAHRVREEVLRFCANSFDADGSGLLAPEAPGEAAANLRLALDFQMQQRVFSRLSGSRERLEAPVRGLLSLSERAGFSGSVHRLERLLRRLQQEGTADFLTA